MSTCILSIDTCLLAICERGLDDSSHVSLYMHPTLALTRPSRLLLVYFLALLLLAWMHMVHVD